MPFWTRAMSTGLTAETGEPCSCSGATSLHPGICKASTYGHKLSNSYAALYSLLRRVHCAQMLCVLQDRILSRSTLGIIAGHLQAWMPTFATKTPQYVIFSWVTTRHWQIPLKHPQLPAWQGDAWQGNKAGVRKRCTAADITGSC